MRQLLILAILILHVHPVSCGKEKNIYSGSGFKYSGDWDSQEFTVTSDTRDKLDVLLVIDTSDTMTEQRKILAGKLDALLGSISNRDWKIAIATTNAQTDCLHAIITKDNPEAFVQTINAMQGGNNDEQAIKVVINALRGLPVRQGNDCSGAPLAWRRAAKDSALAVIIVTDEDHQCSPDTHGRECKLQELYDLWELMGYIPRVTAKLYGFLGDDNDRSEFLKWQDEAGESIFASVRNVKSSAAEYESTLKEISVGMSGIYQTRFTLKRKHDGEKSEVLVILSDDTVQTLSAEQYGFVGNELVIISILPKNTAEIKVNYSYASNSN